MSTSIEWNAPAGHIVGEVVNGVSYARGIRYAKAARFQIPVQEDAVDKIIATTPCPACPQPPDRFSIAIGQDATEGMLRDEDCLRLTVCCPLTDDKKLPVMIWIHGGSYTNGAGDAKAYDSSILVKQENVICVNVTYRLGLLGYLSDGKGGAVNLGLLDQIEALKWVNKNIESFGGDPKNITVFGESAGADAAAHLMIAQGTEGLFQNAIIQSAPFGVLKDRIKMLRAMTEASKEVTTETSLERVHAVQTIALQKAQGFGMGSYMPFGCQYGVFPLPLETEVDAAFKRVAPRFNVLVGYNEREAAIFSFFFPALRIMLSIPLISSTLGAMAVSKSTKDIYGQGVEDFYLRHRSGGGNVWKYIFKSVSNDKFIAAGHSTEIPLLLGDPSYWKGSRMVSGIPWDTYLTQSKTLKQIWGSFARTGSSTSKDIPGLILIE